MLLVAYPRCRGFSIARIADGAGETAVSHCQQFAVPLRRHPDFELYFRRNDGYNPAERGHITGEEPCLSALNGERACRDRSCGRDGYAWQF